MRCHLCLKEKLTEVDKAIRSSLTDVSPVPASYWKLSANYWDKIHLTQTNVVEHWLRNKKMHKIQFIRSCGACYEVKQSAKGKWAMDLSRCHACMDAGAAKVDWEKCKAAS